MRTKFMILAFLATSIGLLGNAYAAGGCGDVGCYGLSAKSTDAQKSVAVGDKKKVAATETQNAEEKHRAESKGMLGSAFDPSESAH